jgi:hypothetical protein
VADKTELEEQVAKLTAVVEEMRARIARIEGPAREVALEAPRSRRDLLKLGGAAALGAVGAAALRAVPAAANNGDNVVAGQDVTATAKTSITATTPLSFDVLQVSAFDTDATALTTALGSTGQLGGAIQGLGGPSLAAKPDLREGVDGWASGDSAFGVYGLTDTGVGVAGESGTGVSVYARGTGRILQDPMAAGVPAYAPNDMEQVRDADGTLWLSNAAGNWRRATTFELFPSPKRVYGKGLFVPKGGKVLNIDATTSIGLTPTGVPAGAQAAWCAVASYEACVLHIYPADIPDPLFANFGVMGTAGISLQVSFLMVPLDASGKFSFTNVKTAARIFVDVWGFLTQS